MEYFLRKKKREHGRSPYKQRRVWLPIPSIATEFHIQGLELDWSCVTWDGDLRFSNEGWKTFAFKGNQW